MGGKKGAAIGAAGGALYQHHKNKKAARAAEQSSDSSRGDSQPLYPVTGPVRRGRCESPAAVPPGAAEHPNAQATWGHLGLDLDSRRLPVFK